MKLFLVLLLCNIIIANYVNGKFDNTYVEPVKVHTYTMKGRLLYPRTYTCKLLDLTENYVSNQVTLDIIKKARASTQVTTFNYKHMGWKEANTLAMTMVNSFMASTNDIERNSCLKTTGTPIENNCFKEIATKISQDLDRVHRHPHTIIVAPVAMQAIVVGSGKQPTVDVGLGPIFLQMFEF
ncbi:uncharacterized protein LOC128952256 [Oppia nitens]|uniref:uncharacterized protein LOC128952256 n=1 Tax=Oppia nitens TaxID=1686743 RepID=UPI0023DCC128|nr:uncharacterized protein LOC128952256 [Oppia nitens]